MGSTAGATPAGAALLSAFFALVALKYLINHTLAMPRAAVTSAKEGSYMKRAEFLFASVLDTFHGLGVSGLASSLLTKASLLDSTASRGELALAIVKWAHALHLLQK